MNLDRTFCMSPNCTNQCGRQWTKNHEQAAKRCGKDQISMAYFCGEPKRNEIEDQEGT